MNKRDRAQLFRKRLLQALGQDHVSQAELARAAGIDRSTLAQLLREDGTRTPNGHTIAEIAGCLKVSTDWLLGLSSQPQPVAEVLDGSLQIARGSQSPIDQNLSLWYDEARGYKIRHVPTTLPDPLKIEAVLRYEFEPGVEKTADQAIAESAVRLGYMRLPETDMEVCVPRQSIEGFVQGTDVWAGLPATIRREQIDHMTSVIDELYPTLRLYLYDARRTFSVPFTLFGPLRAAVYIGQAYFVFNTTKHIRLLTQHFDTLVRQAVVQAHEMTDFLDTMRRHMPTV